MKEFRISQELRNHFHQRSHASGLANARGRRVQQDLVSQDTLDKQDKSPVTVSDFGAQAVVSSILQDAFPDIPLLGEEDASSLREPVQAEIRDNVCRQVQARLPDLAPDAILAAIDRGTYEGGPAGRHWVLDPIDGTKGFLRKEQYAVALALVEDGEIVLGVLGCPNLPMSYEPPSESAGCLFLAVRGQGARMQSLDGSQSRQIRVTEIAGASGARFCESVEAAHSSHSDAAQIADRLGVTEPPFRIDSQCKYGCVARGDASIYLRLPTRKGYEEKVWEHAAGTIVVQEAGGTGTDVDGNPLDYSIGRTLKNNTGVIATNGRLHEEVLEAVQAVLHR